MKKLIALLLALLMVSSAVIAVSAEGTGEVVPTAPTIFAQTEPVIDKGEDEESAEDDTIVGYNVRFLAAVHETTGEAIGFEVVAKYSGKEDAYSKAEGDTAMEGTMLYKNVMVEGESKPVTNYDADAIGMFAAGINGVPTNLDIVFEIKAYITYGESEKVETGVVTAQYANGKILSMTGADVYTQDFNAEKSSAEALADTGVSNLYSGKMALAIEDQKLSVPSTTWGNGPFVKLVGTDYFENNIAKLNTYVIEMDLDIRKINNIAFMINGSVDDSTSESNAYGTRTGAAVVQFKIDGDKKDFVSNLSDKSFYARTGYTNNGSQTIASAYGPAIYKIDSISAIFKLSILVDNTPADGCDILIYVNDQLKNVRQLREADILGAANAEKEVFDVTADSYVSLWAQESAFTIDNLTVSPIDTYADWTANYDAEDPTKLLGYSGGTYTKDNTDTNAVYLQNFNNDPVHEVNVGRTYYSNLCTGGLFTSIINSTDGNKQLQISSHAWHNTPDYFANVVPATEVNGAELYKFEADVSITSVTNFGFTLNNKHLSTNSGANVYLSNYLFIKFDKANNQLVVTEADSTGNTGVGQTKYSVTPADWANFKFTVIVDSTDEDACVLYIFFDNQLVAVHTTASNAWDVADATDVSTIGVFAQGTVATIDNIKFTGVKKNS